LECALWDPRHNPRINFADVSTGSILTLTIVLATFFIMGGFFRIGAARMMRPEESREAVVRPIGGWRWLALSGAFSLLLGVIQLLRLPVSAIWALGLLVGIDFLFLGFAEISIATALGKSER
jgi:uncharacterized membrane protein HdeD (DUF308 family)